MLKVYSASWCNPCKMLKQMLDKNNVEYTVVDIDKEPEDARAAGIRGVPTIVNTETSKTLVGAITFNQLKEIL